MDKSKIISLIKTYQALVENFWLAAENARSRSKDYERKKMDLSNHMSGNRVSTIVTDNAIYTNAVGTGVNVQYMKALPLDSNPRQKPEVVKKLEYSKLRYEEAIAKERQANKDKCDAVHRLSAKLHEVQKEYPDGVIYQNKRYYCQGNDLKTQQL